MMTTLTSHDRNQDVSVDDTEPAPQVASRLDQPPSGRSRLRSVCFAMLLALPFVLAIAVGGLKFVGWTQSESARAQIESVRAASDTAIAVLSYRPDTVQNDLDAAKGRMTGSFKDSYSSLVDNVVAPGAIQKLISAQATVPAAASVRPATITRS